MANTPSMTIMNDIRFNRYALGVQNVVMIAKDIDGNTGLTNDNYNESLTVDEELAIRLQNCMERPSKRKARKSGKKSAKKSVPINGQLLSVANTSGAGKQINKKKKKNKKKNKKSRNNPIIVQYLYVSDSEDELADTAADADDEAIVGDDIIGFESNFSHKYESRQYYSGRQFRQKRQKFKANQWRDTL